MFLLVSKMTNDSINVILLIFDVGCAVALAASWIFAAQ